MAPADQYAAVLHCRTVPGPGRHAQQTLPVKAMDAQREGHLGVEGSWSTTLACPGNNRQMVWIKAGSDEGKPFFTGNP
jgi:hypothetical protein